MAAAKKDRTKKTARNVVIGVVAIVAIALAVPALTGGDDDEPDEETASEEETDTSTTLPVETTTTTIDPATFSNPEVATEVLGREAPDPEAPPEDTAADALEVTTLIEGQGDAGTAADGYVVHYVGKTADGEVLDESWTKGPFPVAGPLSEASLIDGWKEGLVGAKIGERRHLVIGADKGYGDGPLAFDIDVIDIQRAAG